MMRLQYLGNDLEELRGRTVFDDNSIVTLPVLPLPGIVLVPGVVIPLNLLFPMEVSMVKKLAETDKTFGIITYRYPFTLWWCVCCVHLTFGWVLFVVEYCVACHTISISR